MIVIILFVLLFLGSDQSLLMSVQETPFMYKSYQKGSLCSKSYACGICGRIFKRTTDLDRHLLIHTGEKPFTCLVCNTSFRKKDHLNRHNLIHTGEKPHSCSVCGKAFARKDQLTQHLKSHNIVNLCSTETF